MKRLFMIVLFPIIATAQGVGLKSFIEHAQKENGQIRAKEFAVKAGEKSVESAQSAFWPTLDIGGSYSKFNPKYLVSPGRVATGFVSANLDLYDGGRKRATLKAKKYERQASLFEKQAFEKSVTLQIVRFYYGIKQLQANLKALQDRSRELEAQIRRIKKFLATGLATREQVDKLEAAFENNRYMIENIKLAIKTNRQNLRLTTGLEVGELAPSYFAEPENIAFEWFDMIKTLEAKAKAAEESVHAIDAAYKPQVALSDTYHRSDFDDLKPSAMPGMGENFLIDKQNELKLSVHMRLFDKGTIAKESDALRYRKMALLSELDHARKQQKMNYRLAKENLKTTRAKIESARSTLRAADSTYATIKKKFEVGVVDNIAFLDALAQKTLAQARYKETKYDYEIKKSIYYYYAGKDPKEFIR